MPQYLMTGEVFLGKFRIEEVVAYSDIYYHSMRNKKTVFKNIKPKDRQNKKETLSNVKIHSSTKDNEKKDEDQLKYYFIDVKEKFVEGKGIMKPDLYHRITHKQQVYMQNMPKRFHCWHI